MKLLAPALAVAALCAPAFADGTDPEPHATGLQVGMRFPWDVTIGPNVVGIGTAGLGLDLGERVTDRLYLGVATEYEMVMNISESMPALSGLEHRLRGGVEARYYFHTGTATVGGGAGDGCCCYSEPVVVPRHDWVGLRFGEETVDEFTTHGAFADLTLGTDAQIGTTQVGVYVSAGLTSEPASAYATNPQAAYLATAGAPAIPSVTSYDFTLGIHLAFGG